MGVVAAVVGAIGAVAQASAARKSAKAQEKSLELQQEQQEVNTRRSQRSNIREMQIRRAQAVSAAGGVGASFGSGIAGGVSSLSSQSGEALGFSTQMSGLSREITRYDTQAGRYASRANMFGAISGLGFQLYSMGGKPKPTYAGPTDYGL